MQRKVSPRDYKSGKVAGLTVVMIALDEGGGIPCKTGVPTARHNIFQLLFI